MRKTELIRSLVILLVISLCLPLIACDLPGAETAVAPETTAPETTKAPDAEQTRVLSTMKTEEPETKAPAPEKPSNNEKPGNNSSDAKYKAVGHIVVYAEGYMVFDSRNYGLHSYSSNTTKPTLVAFLNSYCRKNGDILECDIYGSKLDSITVKNGYGDTEFAASENTYWDYYILEDSSMSVLDDRMVYTVVFNLRTRSGATETTRRPATTVPSTAVMPETTEGPETTEAPETLGFDGILYYEPVFNTIEWKDEYYVLDCHLDYVSVNIPSEFNGYSVTGISNSAFSYCYNLEFLNIPSSVKYIGNYAFYDSGIREINFYGYQYQWEAAIANSYEWNAGTSEVTVYCYDNVLTYYGEYHIPEVTPETTPEEYPIPPETIPYDHVDYPLWYVYDYDRGEYYVYSCEDEYSDVSIASSINGFPVSAIYSYAFDDCYSLRSLYIPSSVTYIGDYAFDDCYNLSHIEFGGYGYQWEAAISASEYWNDWTADITVSCYDVLYVYSAQYGTPEETVPEESVPAPEESTPDGYVYRSIEEISFLCPSHWEQTTAQGNTVYVDNRTGANIVVISTEKTDIYYNMTVNDFREEVAATYEQLGAKIKSIDYGSNVINGYWVMRGYVEVEVNETTVMIQEMIIISTDTKTYVINLSYTPDNLTDESLSDIIISSIAPIY